MNNVTVTIDNNIQIHFFFGKHFNWFLGRSDARPKIDRTVDRVVRRSHALCNRFARGRKTSRKNTRKELGRSVKILIPARKTTFSYGVLVFERRFADCYYIDSRAQTGSKRNSETACADRRIHFASDASLKSLTEVSVPTRFRDFEIDSFAVFRGLWLYDT